MREKRCFVEVDTDDAANLVTSTVVVSTSSSTGSLTLGKNSYYYYVNVLHKVEICSVPELSTSNYEFLK